MFIAQILVSDVNHYVSDFITPYLDVFVRMFSGQQTVNAFHELSLTCFIPCLLLTTILMLILWTIAGISVAAGLDRRRGYGGGLNLLVCGIAIIGAAKLNYPDCYSLILFCLVVLIMLIQIVFAAKEIFKRIDCSNTRKAAAIIATVILDISMLFGGAIICDLVFRSPVALLIVIPFLSWNSRTCGGDISYFLSSSRMWISVRMICSLVWIASVASIIINMKAGDTSINSMFDFLLSSGLVGLLQSAFLFAVWGASVRDAANTEHYFLWYDSFGNLIHRERDAGGDMMGCLGTVILGFLMIAFLSAFFAPFVFIVNCIQYADVWTRGTRVHILSVLIALIISALTLYGIPKTWDYISNRVDEISACAEAEKRARQSNTSNSFFHGGAPNIRISAPHRWR